MRLYAKFEGSAPIVSIFRAILARFVIYKNGPKKTPKKFRIFFQNGPKKGPFWEKFAQHDFRKSQEVSEWYVKRSRKYKNQSSGTLCSVNRNHTKGSWSLSHCGPSWQVWSRSDLKWPTYAAKPIFCRFLPFLAPKMGNSKIWKKHPEILGWWS